MSVYYLAIDLITITKHREQLMHLLRRAFFTACIHYAGTFVVSHIFRIGKNCALFGSGIYVSGKLLVCAAKENKWGIGGIMAVFHSRGFRIFSCRRGILYRIGNIYVTYN